MRIQLDHIQRLNLHALLGAQRGDLATIRALWALQDSLSLTTGEEEAIELKREFAAGQERIVWNPAVILPPKEFEFTEGSIARIKSALESWDGYGVGADRKWLEPLLDLLAASEPIS